MDTKSSTFSTKSQIIQHYVLFNGWVHSRPLPGGMVLPFVFLVQHYIYIKNKPVYLQIFVMEFHFIAGLNTNLNFREDSVL